MNNKRMATETENNNPDLNYDNELAVNEEEKEAQREENMALLKKLYEKRDKEAGKIFGKVEDEISESKNGIRGLVKMRGGDYANVSSRLRQELTKEQAEIESEIIDLECRALEIPGDLEGETSSPDEFKMEIPEEIRKLERKTEELASEAIDAREVLVEKFIKDSIFSRDGINEYFANSFDKAINGKNAKDIIDYKTEKEIRFAAKRFIETGDKADFGFRAKLEITAYKTKQRNKEVEKNFITGFTIYIGGYQMRSGESCSPEGKRLLPMSAAINRDDERRYGGRIDKQEVK